MVNGALVVHLLHDAARDNPASVPALSVEGAPARPLLRAQDVHQPLLHAGKSVLNTLVRCEMQAGTFDCKARALAAPSTLADVIADDAVYSWFVVAFDDLWQPWQGATRTGHAAAR